jgi:membrane protease YdiL (CAAX protease family)
VLLVCGGPILITAVVYPNLPERPFVNADWTMWALTPLREDLLFAGFLYGQFALAFPGNVHRRVALNRSLALTAIFFALWHVANLGNGMSGAYVAFQVIYVGVGATVIGLSRQWTGSVYYGMITHAATNAIALVFS